MNTWFETSLNNLARHCFKTVAPALKGLGSCQETPPVSHPISRKTSLGQGVCDRLGHIEERQAPSAYGRRHSHPRAREGASQTSLSHAVRSAEAGVCPLSTSTHLCLKASHGIFGGSLARAAKTGALSFTAAKCLPLSLKCPGWQGGSL